jgi:hypothetical protein
METREVSLKADKVSPGDGIAFNKHFKGDGAGG